MRTTMHLLCLGALLLLTFPAIGQEPDTRFLRDLTLTRNFMLGRPVRPKPTPDGKAVLFLRGEARSPKLRLYEFDVATGKARELLTPEQVLKGAEEQLSPEEKARRERQRVSVGGFTDFQLSADGSAVLLSLSGRLYLLNRGDGSVRELKTGPGTLLDPQFSPDGKSVAYVLDYDVYALDLATQKERRLTTGGTEVKTHGLAEFVAQEEMGRFSGFWWAPDSKSIAFEEADASGVEVWYIADPANPDRPPLPARYPRPGKANVKVRLGVVVADGGGSPTWVEWDHDRYEYLAGVKWEEGGPLCLTVQTRDQKELALLKADPATGATTPLLTEHDAAWVNLDQQMPKWLDDGNGFLWTSEREGGWQLEYRDPKGKLRRVLVPPTAGYRDLVDVDLRLGRILFHASTDPTQSHLMAGNFRGDDPTPLTTAPGLHTAVYAKNHRAHVRQESSITAMPRTTVYRADREVVDELPSVAEQPPFVPRVEVVKVGKERTFYASVVRPRDFAAGKRYPVLVDVYGGPQSNQVVTSMGHRLLAQWLADQGFIVAAVDGRGTPGRGREWERVIRERFGSVPLDDQVAGLKALGERFPEMDLNRVGIVGWSFGGYLSALAVLRRPDVFRAAVAGAPVVDWLDYDTHYTERYLGLPENQPQAYREGSLLTYAAELKRPLLVVHGTADDNVYFRHSLKLADALFRAGKEFELVPLAGLTHMRSDPAVSERLWARAVGHFRKHLAEK